MTSIESPTPSRLAFKRSAPTNLLFYLDEARDWIPAGTRKPPAKEPLIRLFTQGRKYGVAGLICTQSPRSVDYSVFGNTSTKIIGRLEAAQDVQRVEQWFDTEGGAPEWVARRNGAAKGSFVARWPDMPATQEAAVEEFWGQYPAIPGSWRRAPRRALALVEGCLRSVAGVRLRARERRARRRRVLGSGAGEPR